MNLVEHVLPNGLLFGRFGNERVAHALVVAGNAHAAADAQFFNQAGCVKAAADDADAAHQAGRVGKDFVGGGGNVVAAGCTHVFGDDIHGDIRVFRLDAADFGKRGVGHDGRAAGAVGVNDDGAHVFIAVGRLHALAQHVHLANAVVAANRAVQINHGGVRPSGGRGGKCSLFGFLRAAVAQSRNEGDKHQ